MSAVVCLIEDGMGVKVSLNDLATWKLDKTVQYT